MTSNRERNLSADAVFPGGVYQALGFRLRVAPSGAWFYDNHPISIPDAVRKANELRAVEGLKPIKYPGAEPIHSGDRERERKAEKGARS